MQRCPFCTRYLNPKAFACTYCGKKTGRQETAVLTTAVSLPPLEYAGGVVGAVGTMVSTPAAPSHTAPSHAAPSQAARSSAPDEIDLASFDVGLAAVAEQGMRRRWFRSGRSGR